MLQRKRIERPDRPRQTGRPAPAPVPEPKAPAALADPARGVELAVRKGDGLEVSLLWNRSSGRVWVDVLHVFTGESFQVDADPARALDVYRHPFAYCPGGRATHAMGPGFEGEVQLQ